MKKPNLIELAGCSVTAVFTGATADSLADHSVGVFVIVSVVLSMLSSGLTLTDRLAKASTTEAYRCATQGCQVAFQVTRNHPADKRAVLRDLAADHARHGSAGV